MTRDELIAALRILRWSVPDLAHILGRSRHTISNYTRLDGVCVPKDIAEWLERRVVEAKANFLADPPPRVLKGK